MLAMRKALLSLVNQFSESSMSVIPLTLQQMIATVALLFAAYISYELVSTSRVTAVIAAITKGCWER